MPPEQRDEALHPRLLLQEELADRGKALGQARGEDGTFNYAASREPATIPCGERKGRYLDLSDVYEVAQT
jgi:hypothetical protein